MIIRIIIIIIIIIIIYIFIYTHTHMYPALPVASTLFDSQIGTDIIIVSMNIIMSYRCDYYS